MPDLDGVTIVDKIKACVSPMPHYLLMVGHYDKDELKMQAPGQEQYIIEKPLMRIEIHDAITRLIKGEPFEWEAQQRNNKTAPDLSGCQILLVEDSTINRQVALGFLSDTDAKVVTATNGIEAINKVQRHTFDLILMDIEMPQMDGIIATKTIRNKLKLTHIPIIAMTAHAMMGVDAHFKFSGMDDHLAKPFEPESLYQILSNHLGHMSKGIKQSGGTVEAAPVSKEALKLITALTCIEGLDCAHALARMNGKTTLYLELIREFVKIEGLLPTTLRQFFEQEDWQEVHRAVHSLKSNGAFIGAYEISQLSGALENRYGKGAYEFKALETLCTALQTLVTTIDSTLQQKDQSTVNSVFDRAQFIAQLNSLIPLLKSTDFAAEELLIEMKDHCKATEHDTSVQNMMDEVEDIEFEKAALLAQILLDTLSGQNDGDE